MHPGKDFNASDDFLTVVVKSMIITAACKVLGMPSTSDNPQESVVPYSTWLEATDAERKALLISVSKKIVSNSVFFCFTTPCLRSQDKVMEYSKFLLGLGCFYMEFSDGIRQGDGTRVLRCWRYMLPIFHSSRRTNYRNEAILLLYQHDFLLSPADAETLIWNRFINVHGKPGCNIPQDLHMEHLNRIVKEAVKGLGSNKTAEAICRVARALGTIAPVLDNFDTVNNTAHQHSSHSVVSADRDIQVVVKDLLKYNIFECVEPRSHTTYSNPKDVLSCMNLHDWIKSKIPKLHHTH